jgi:23S rRNA (guanosine2251-2'-O)-methyltransferase
LILQRHSNFPVLSQFMASQETELIVGRNPVVEVLRERPTEIEKIFIQKSAQGSIVDEIRSTADTSDVPVQHVPSQRIDQMVPGHTHQGIVARTAPLAYHQFDEMLSEIAPRYEDVQARKPLLLMIDQVTDTHNFGAILRTSVAAGVAGVIVPAQHMAPLNTTTIKASAGLAGHVPVARVRSLTNSIDRLKERGYWITGLTKKGGTSIWETDWVRPRVLIVGSEGKGMRPSTEEKCDVLVSIPMPGSAESLNVSVAAGTALFSAVRQRLDAS